MRMPEGTIKRKTDKGFGFIETGSGKDMFFHSSNVEGSGYDSPARRTKGLVHRRSWAQRAAGGERDAALN